MVTPFRKFSTKKEAILTSKIDQLIITIGIIYLRNVLIVKSSVIFIILMLFKNWLATMLQKTDKKVFVSRILASISVYKAC